MYLAGQPRGLGPTDIFSASPYRGGAAVNEWLEAHSDYNRGVGAKRRAGAQRDLGWSRRTAVPFLRDGIRTPPGGEVE